MLQPKLRTHHSVGTLLAALGLLSSPVAFAFLRPLLLMSAIFLLVGFLLRRAAWPAALRREQRQRLRVLEWGLPVEAELLRVERHALPMLEAGRVAQLDYAFTVRGQRILGSMPSPHAADARRSPGERAWAVYLDEDPRVSALWPPGP